MRLSYHRCLIALLFLSLVGEPGAVAQESSSPTSATLSTEHSKLFKDSRQMLAIARAQGRKNVILLVAAKPGEAPKVAERAEQLGGNVRYQENEVGYLRVRMPVDQVSEFVGFDGIESAAMDVDDSYPLRLMGNIPLEPDSTADQGANPSKSTATERPSSSASRQATEQWPPKWGDYPLRHPYSPLADIDAAKLLSKHPTFDGRGVTIALLDGNFDLLLPEFQTAYSLDGKRVPKVADFLNVTDPRDDADLMPQWVDMREVVEARDGHVSFRGKKFTVPHNGQYRIGFFNERKFNDPSNAAYIDQDIDRDGNPKGDDGLFGVLWDEQTNEVWVDTNRNLSFTDEHAMTDYVKRHDVGVFGKDKASTPIRESIGFAVQTDPQNKFVSINVGIYQHATEIMGSVIGNRYPKGRLQGVAPGARIVSMFYGMGIAHSMIEGLIAAFKNPQVDLIVMEQSVAIASMPYLLADAHHPISIIAQRLIERYHKLLFVPGSNSPGFGIVAEDGLAPGAISVGGYQSQESYRLNAGFIPEFKDDMHWGALSHAPSGTGALKPDLLAPSGQMSTDPGFRKGAVIRGLFQLPPGYSVDGGTSTATPMAAGATALVVSAAKQTGVPYDAARLKSALVGSARYIPNLTAYEQGNGLIQVEAALELLKRLEKISIVKITSRAPVHTRLSNLLPTPNVGVGLYEREGWKVGDQRTRTITFTRTSGPAEAMTFALSWQGNDGTFASASSLTLPLNRLVELPVSITVKNAGPHSAILTLDHPSIPGHAYRVLNSVVAPLEFTAANKYVINTEVTVPRPGDRGVFVEVPTGAAALTFSATTTDGTVRLSAISPSREQMFLNPPPGQGYAVAHPEAGVWEVNVCMNSEARDFDPSREMPLKPTPVKVTVKLVGVELGTGEATASSVPAGGSFNLPIKMTNRFAAVSAALTSEAVASSFQTTRSIKQGEQQMYEVMVPKGATSLRARVNGVTDANADLDVYLLDCTATEKKPSEAAPPEKEKGNKAPPMPPPNCTPRAKAATVDAGGEVEIPNPAAGRWAIVVDAFSVPDGQTSYNYVDVFAHPRFGGVTAADDGEQREPGSSWDSTAHVWVASPPHAPRTTQAILDVISPEVQVNNRQAVPLGELWMPLGPPMSAEK